MDQITLDFETYYDKDCSLRKLTTCEYVKHPKFKVWGVGIKVNNEPTRWYSEKDTNRAIQKIDWTKSSLIAHNTKFDGYILRQIYGCTPAYYYDTMAMSRARFPDESASLASLSERLFPEDPSLRKGEELVNAKGIETLDAELDQTIGEYCIQDVELTRLAWDELVLNFPVAERDLINITCRMFIEPTLQVDIDALTEYRDDQIAHAEELIKESGIERSVLASNQQFTELLEDLNIIVPTKRSPSTGKTIPALGINDPGYQQMVASYPDYAKVFRARKAVKSRIAETRATRFLNATHLDRTISVPLSYYAAHTGRFGGNDKLNMQNMPRDSVLRKSLLAPEGHYVYVADLSNIEARMLAWVSGQTDLLTQFAQGEDIYSNFASKIYNQEINKKDHPKERFVGKTAILGLGYGMGADKFEMTLKANKISLESGQAKDIVMTYRNTYAQIRDYWRLCEQALHSSLNTASIGNRFGPLFIGPQSLYLPNQLALQYKDLIFTPQQGFQYKRGKRTVYAYGGSITENIVQALARIIITDAMLRIEKKYPDYRIVLTVHDEIIIVADDNNPKEKMDNIIKEMCIAPDWCPDIPLEAEGGYAENYSK